MSLLHRRFYKYSNRLFRKSLSQFLCSVSGETNPEYPNIFTHLARRPGTPNRIHLIESETDWNNIVPVLTRSLETFPAVGFDCEWPPNPLPDWSAADTEEKLREMEDSFKRRRGRDKVSLIQLATLDGTAILVRLNKLDNVPISLRELLANPSCLKVGIETTLDGRHLTKDYPTDLSEIRGTFDIRYLLLSSTWESGEHGIRTKKKGTSLSLNELCELYLNTKLEKRKSIICSDWAAPQLSSEQIQYAAMDAQCSMDAFVAVLVSLGFKIDKDGWEKIHERCRPAVDNVVKLDTSSTRSNRWKRRNTVKSSLSGELDSSNDGSNAT